MSAVHHKYYPIEVLEKELLMCQKIYNSWSDQSKLDYSEKYSDLGKKIKQLERSIESLKQLV